MKCRVRAVLVLFSLVSVCFLVAGPIEGSSERGAEQLFIDAQKALARGDYDGAEALLGESLARDSTFVSAIWQLAANGEELAQPVPVATGLLGPEGIAVDRDGTLLVVEGNAGRVSRVNPQSGAVTPVVSGLALGLAGIGTLPPFATLTGIAVGPSGAVYVSGDAGLVVYKLVPQTAVVTYAIESASRDVTRLQVPLIFCHQPASASAAQPCPRPTQIP